MKRSDKPLTVAEIVELRAQIKWNKQVAVAITMPPGGHGLKKRKGDCIQSPDLKKVKLTVQASLTNSDTRTNTLSRQRKPFTILLWNVESYGEHKSRGNPFANRVIRGLMEELAVDVAIFLETKSVPSDPVFGLEHSLDASMRTSKEKKKSPGVDLTIRRIFPEELLDEMEEEREAWETIRDKTREEIDALLQSSMDEELVSRVRRLLGDLDWVHEFHPIVSDSTGKLKPLPPKIGPARSWPRGTSAAVKQDDIARFKRDYSYDSTRCMAHWLLHHYSDLADLYDLRFALELPDEENEYPSYDDHNLTRPATRAEVAALRRAIRAMTYSEGDLESDRKASERLASLQAMEVETLGSMPGGSAIDRSHRKLQKETIDVEMQEEIAETAAEQKKPFKQLLRDMERLAVLTLKGDAATLQAKIARRPPRDVIGRRNEGNSCYLNAVLHLLACIPRDRYASASPSEPAIVAAVDGLLATAAAEARDGKYHSSASKLPWSQEEPEQNYVSVQRTEPLRRALQTTCKWRSIYDSEDADEVLRVIFRAYGPAKAPDAAAIETAWTQGTQGAFDPIRPTRLHFFTRTAKTLAVATMPEAVSATLGGNPLSVCSYDMLNVLPLRIPPDGTYEAALSLFLNPTDPCGPMNVEHGGHTWTSAIESQSVEAEAPQDYLLVRVERMTYAQKGTKVPYKISDPITLPAKIGDRVLLGFIHHHGANPDDGHYTAWVRRGERWYVVDDSIVAPREWSEVQTMLPQAYICCYGPKPDPPPPTQAPVMDAGDEKSGSDDEDADTPMSELCPALGEIFEQDRGASEHYKGALPEPRNVDQARLRECSQLLSDMIGVRVVETYTILYRRNGQRQEVATHVPSAYHKNVGHHVYKHELLSVDQHGHEMGFQDPLMIINGRCPFYFELDVWRPLTSQAIRVPVVALHAPYGLPALFAEPGASKKKQQTKKEPLDTDDAPSKTAPLDFDTSPKAVEMRAEAMKNLLALGIRSYAAVPEQQKGQVVRERLDAFANAIIAGDFNLNALKRKESTVIDDAYGTLEAAGFVAGVGPVATTMHPPENKLPAGDGTADPKTDWYGSAYDNIFVRGVDLGIATTEDGTLVSGAVDVLDFIHKHRDDVLSNGKTLFATAEEVIGNTATYHKAKYTPARRAAHEKKRWAKAADVEHGQAYMLYRRYISDHLPVFVDLDLGGGTGVAKSVPLLQSSSSKREKREVIGIENYGNTCYLNSVLQLLAVYDAEWQVDKPAEPALRDEVRSFLAAMAKNAADATYDGDGSEFTSESPSRACFTHAYTHAIRHQMGRNRLAFHHGRQEDAAEALEAILIGCARKQSDKSDPDALNLSPAVLSAAGANGTLEEMRPSGAYLFVQRRQWYWQVPNVSPPADGIILDQHWSATVIEAESLLRLPLADDTATLQQAWTAYSSRQFAYDADNTRAVDHNGTTYHSSIQRDTIVSMPEPDWLLVQLVRFEWFRDPETKADRRRKITRKVDASAGLAIGTTQYDVAAVVQHKGETLEFGHYVAFVHKAGHWYEINDVTVTRDPPSLAAAMEQGYIYLLRKK